MANSESIAAYASSAGADIVDQLRALAVPLRGARVLHLNATNGHTLRRAIQEQVGRGGPVRPARDAQSARGGCQNHPPG